jgi:2-polyprenyl-6-methoxyphenol hydroxylase-like FAD-dependent oxidoreductase
MAATHVSTRCCVVGGGPAGMMLGFLLARAGVETVVLEKHGDFLRDFRGDTIHPSTLELMHELGLLDEFLKLPHQKVTTLSGQIGDTRIHLADFSRIPTHCKFIALMPQWNFLNFMAEQGRRYRTFDLRMKANATGLIESGGRVVGVSCETPDGPLDIRADLVVGADGRHSMVRERAGFRVEDIGAPMDVFWMRVSRKADDPSEAFGHAEAGRMFVMLNRGDYWQCAYLIPKGGADAERAKGVEAFRASVLVLSPWLGERVNELRSFDDVKLLTVAVDRLTQWYKPGLLCIGDAAHAMSPIGGVGVNLAVQDAVAAANILASPLRERAVTSDHLRAVQERRTLPMRVIQKIQVTIQNRFIVALLSSTERPKAPWPVKLLNWFPPLRAIPARLLGVGIRPEHIGTPDIR